MKTSANIQIAFCFAVLSVVSVSSVSALAQESDVAPKPAAHTLPTLVDSSDPSVDANQNATDTVRPDTRPLTGIQNLTLGTQDLRHSYWVPGFEYGSTSQSRSLATGLPGWSTNNYFGGDLALLSAGSHTQLGLNYSGGAFVSSDRALNNGFYQELGASQSFTWARWSLNFLDEFSYLPETQAGFGGATHLAVPGIQGVLAPTLPEIGSDFALAPSIFASTGAYYTNMFGAETNYAVSPRSAITMAGLYGTLRFTKGGGIDEDEAGANFGYSYALSRTDSIGALYRFRSYHFAGNPEAIGVHSFDFAYGRKITGRLALQLFVGPELAEFRIPLANSTARQQLLASGSVSLKYALQRSDFSVDFHHGVAGGSGILVGTSADQVTLNADRQVTRSWSLRGNIGYEQSRDLGNSSVRFNSWFATAGFTRPLGPTANLTLGYTARFQTATQGVCTGSCFGSFTQHQISLGFQWNTRPIVIR